MATTYKVLGQVQVAGSNAESSLYTVPASTQAVVSTISMIGASGGATVRIRIAINNATSAGKQYLVYDYPLGSLEARFITIGITLGAGDVIYCASSVANSSFQAFGQEIT